MRMMKAVHLLFITISQNVSFTGKTWWLLVLVLRVLVLLLGGFTLFSDEQERFVCNTIQPGCSNVCFDVFAPVSVLRLWLLHLVLLWFPHFMFSIYVVHRLLSFPYLGGRFSDRSRSGSPLGFESFSGEQSLVRDLPRRAAAPRFHCAYFLLVILRILLEAVFAAGQFFLFGLSVPKSFLCYEAPCTSGVECYVSRPTEKTLMLNFMLGVSAASVLLSLADLASSAEAMVRWRRKREELMEEMMEEMSSVFTTTTTTATEDADVLGTGGGSKTSPSPLNAAVPTHFVHRGHSRPPLSPRPDKGPLPNPRATTPAGVKKTTGQYAPNSGQQSDSSECQDRRTWV
ncbi:gap junction delta-4 protein-like [Embiotoca jacksoni]|uniref:gap junction delta-4 protein-like n=1 Tax=Embiotoca jacksoni TaxID=100190 RepID=UPI0037044166